MNTGPNYRLGEEEIHEILSNERRKRALELLKDRAGPVELRDLADGVAEAESDLSSPPRKLRKSVYSSLHQNHLPKLERYGIIDYDTRRKVVSLRSKARRVDRYTEVLTPYGIAWSTYYRTLSVLSLLAIVADQLEVPWFRGEHTVLIASAFLAVIAVSTAYQLRSNNRLRIRGLIGD